MKTLNYLLTVALVFTMFINVYSQKENTESLDTKVVTQIGIVVKDIDKAGKAYADLFGMEKPEPIITDKYEKTNAHYRGEPMKARAKLAFIRLENITIELIEPVGGPSTWQEFLKENGEGVHHIAFDVKGMDKTIGMLEKKGGNLVQRGNFTGGSYSYVEMEEELKVILELLTSD
jgi:predicted enzyme related to lactoylglutathione lyase